MGRNKFGTFIILGALAGAAVSMCDRSTRQQVTEKMKDIMSEVRFYSKNPDILKFKVQEKKVKVQSVVNQISDDASYVKEKLNEFKLLTPQVKELVIETKDAFVEAKGEYKSIVSEG